jgi:hypothetical protein
VHMSLICDKEYHNSKFVIFQEKGLEVSKSYNFLSATTTQLLSNGEICKLLYDTVPIKVHLQTFLSILITQKCQILNCDTLVAHERYINVLIKVLFFHLFC